MRRIPPGKTFVFWQPARKCMQSYHDYVSFCPAKHDVYSVLSTEGGLNVNIGHIVYRKCTHREFSLPKLILQDFFALSSFLVGLLSTPRLQPSVIVNYSTLISLPVPLSIFCLALQHHRKCAHCDLAYVARLFCAI